jgi:hypothetical protein
VGFTVFLAAAVLGPSTPDVNASSAKVISVYARHRGALKAQAYFLGYAAIFLVCFFGVLTHRLRRAGAEALSTVALAGSVVLGVAMAIGAATNLMGTHKSVTLTTSTAQTINLINNDIFIVALVVGLVVMMIPAGIAVLATKALPAWMGWVAIVAGVVAATGPLAWFALIATGLWSLVAAIMLYRRRDAVSSPMATGGSGQIPAQGQPQGADSSMSG